jgi:hypothetical protein
MRKVRTAANFWVGCGIVCCILGIFTLAICKERWTDERDVHINEACHDVDGRDYEGCILREGREYEK